MKQDFRLLTGGSIDRTQRLNFSFNGRSLTGFAGDSLASALLAHGVHFVSRSFKYHRPRGIFSAGEEEPNALLEIGVGADRVPSCRAPLVPLIEGLVAHSQNCWPSLDFDLARVLDYTHPLWPAGFYNKTFKWPSWHAWEGMIRRMSGLGRCPDQPDPDTYEQVSAHCDLLVCGGGPAGLASALVAGRAGLRVILADQDLQPGGALLRENIRLDGQPAAQWLGPIRAELEALPNVLLLPRTTVSGCYDHKVCTLLQQGDGHGWRECFWTVIARRIVLATGAIEQGLVFCNNDRPGIMLASAIRHYLNRYAVVAGRQALIACNNDSAYQTAIDLRQQGVAVQGVVDTRAEVRQELKQQLAQLDVAHFTSTRIANTAGGRRLRSVTIETLSGKNIRKFSCDLLGVSGGWAPRVHLLCHARGTLKFDAASQSFLPARIPQGFRVVGSAAGIADLRQVLQQSMAETLAVCTELGHAAEKFPLPEIHQDLAGSSQTGAVPLQAASRRQWIDLAHDVTFDDAALAVREGFEAVEHFKRFTTAGMSVDQGKTGNLNAFRALAALTGKAIDEIGTTTFRPPYMPVTLGALAGRSQGEFYAPRRYLPAHQTHRLLNARFGDYGGWQRPDCYPQPGEDVETAIHRETTAVRSTVGVFDNSPIGKIEVRGPQAAEFLHRVYINDVHGLATGSVRYGMMLNENGVIIDDGVFCRLADDHFLVNTTSGGVARVLALFEEWLQCQWTDLRVLVDDVTAQWANFTIAGPQARTLLQALGSTIDLSAIALPHMTAACGELAGLPVRVVRVSFSGESSFEINLPASQANRFLAQVLATGSPLGLVPYGIEALMLLRLEKGYLHVGSDTDGETTPDDIGWGRVARAKTTDFIGRRSLSRPANLDPQRKQLVGLVAVDRNQRLHAGAHLLLGEGRSAPALTDGWITSAAFSPHLGHYLALGMLRAGRARQGEVLTAIDASNRYAVRVVPATFFDPLNERLKST